MYLVHTEILRPSALEGAFAACLVAEDAVNLVALRASGVDIYSVHTSAAGQARLILESSHALAGTLRDGAAVRLPGATRDALLLSFSDAKCTLLEWDPDSHALRTVSMHFYETDELKRGYTRFHLPPVVTVDPAMRCAAVVVLDRHIAVLPLNDGGDALATLYGWSGGGARVAKPKNSWVLSCEALGVPHLVTAVFLPGYFQPTLLVLYEDRPTWSGRATVLWNTRAVGAFALDLAARTWSLIWKVEGLGNDVYSVTPVPEPVGGALLLGANAVYYVNQTTRYCMAINIHGTVNPPFANTVHWRSSEGLVLDAARVCVLATTARYASCLVSDKRGVLHVLNLLVGGSTVDSIELAPIGASSVASSMCLVPGGFVFLASRLGDSLLMRCTDASASAAGLEAPSKRARITGSGGSARPEEDALFAELFAGGSASDAIKVERESDAAASLMGGAQGEVDREDLREAALEAQAAALARDANISVIAATKATILWDLGVADSLLAVPITSMILAPSMDPASLSQGDDAAHEQHARHALDVVACSGTERSGCIALLQRSARPDVFMSFEIRFVNAAWALYRGHESPFHQYLVLARRTTTTVMSTSGEEFFAFDAEKDKCALALTASTVGVWTLPGPSGAPHERMLQVTKWEVRLCAGHETLVQCVDARSESRAGWIVSASFAASVLVVLRRNGQLSGWHYNAQRDLLEPLADLDARTDDPAASCFVYEHPVDAHPSWRLMTEEELTLQGVLREMREQGKSQAEIEDMLGGSLADIAASTQQGPPGPSLYVLVSRLSGAVEVWTVDAASGALKPVFWSMGFLKGEGLVTHEAKWSVGSGARAAMGASTAGDEPVAAGVGSATAATAAAAAVAAAAGTALYVQEMSVHRTEDRGVPMLFCVTSHNDLLVYKSIHSTSDTNVLPLRLRRVQVDCVTRSYDETAVATAAPPTVVPELSTEEAAAAAAEEEATALPYSRQLVAFNNVCGRRGVFFKGLHRSGWFFLSAREFPNAMVEHNMAGEGLGLSAFTPFHYQSCRRGFITVSSTGRMQIAQLRLGKGTNKNGEVEGAWIIRKVGLRSPDDLAEGYNVTPFAVDFHPPSGHYVVASMCTRQLRDDSGGLKLPPLEERWRLSLYRVGSWTLSHQVWLEPGEQVLSLRVLSLCRGDDKGPERAVNQPIGTSHLPRKLYVVLGTGFLRNGEDVVGDPIPGNVRLFALVPSVVPDKPFQLSLLMREYVKGPVSQVAEMLGYLIYQVGSKTMMTLLGAEENVLVGKGFFDGQMYCTSLRTIKNYIMFTDQYKSVYWLAWRENVRQLRLLGKDYAQAKIVDANLLVDYDALTMVSFDEDGNVRCFKYDPGSIKTRDGHQLVVTSEYFLGTQVSASVRFACHSLLPNPVYNQAFYKRNGVAAAGVDGSLHLLMPVQETDYRRLQLLQVQMNTGVAHEAGLNPLEHRTYRSFYSTTSNAAKNDDNNPIIDMSRIYTFLAQPVARRRQLARKIGTHQRFILKNLLEVELTSCLF